MQKDRSFTLIELLVVVAIVGLIASIILVNLREVQKKAVVTKALEFSAGMHRALQIEAAGIWDFEESADNTCLGEKDVCDASGFGNHGDNYGATRTTDTPYQAIGKSGGRRALDFDGGDYIRVPDNDSLDITGDMTIELWLKYDTWSAWDYFVGKGSDSASDMNYNLQFSDTMGNYCFDYTNSSNQWCGCDEGNTALSSKTWYHLSVVYKKSTRRYSYFLNGAPDGGGTGTGTMDTTSYGLGIGADGAGNLRFDGIIDDVRVYKVALTAVEIQKHYAEGLTGYKYVKR